MSDLKNWNIVPLIISCRISSEPFYHLINIQSEAGVFCKKRCSQKFRKVHRKTPVPECRPQACNFIKKETLEQVFSGEFCEISINTFSTKRSRATTSILFSYIYSFTFAKSKSLILIQSSFLFFVLSIFYYSIYQKSELSKDSQNNNHT